MSHRFFGALETETRARLPAAEAEHARRVLRLRDGAEIQILTEDGRSYAGQLRFSEGEAFAEELVPLPSTEPPVDVTLYMGIPKGEKLELISQKLTEIGVKRIVPVRTERCVAKIEPKEAEKKLSRPRRIAAEAQKQSGRSIAPEITDPVNIADLPELFKTHDRVFLLWEEADGYHLSDARRDTPDITDIAYIVGSEGGISPKEAAFLKEAGAEYITLGPRILRAETAAIAGAAAILTLWGDL